MASVLGDMFPWASSAGGALGGVANTLEGDPASLSNSLQQLMTKAYRQGNNIKNFLMTQKGNSEAYYKPLQQMFTSMYGTGGLMPAKAPVAPGGGGAY